MKSRQLSSDDSGTNNPPIITARFKNNFDLDKAISNEKKPQKPRTCKYISWVNQWLELPFHSLCCCCSVYG